MVLAKARSKWLVFFVIVLLWMVGLVGVIIAIYQQPDVPAGSSYLLEAIKAGFLVLGGLGVILPTYLNVWNSLETQKLAKEERDERHQQLQETIRRQLIENTHALIERWDSPTLLEARKRTRAAAASRAESDDAFVASIDSDELLLHAVFSIFNYFDLVRLSIENQRVEVDIVKRSLQVPFSKAYRNYSPWLDRQEQVYRDDLEKVAQALDCATV